MSFSLQRYLMVFHWILSDSKSPHVSTSLISILADLNNAVVWMASTRSLFSKSSSPFINPSVTVPRAPITIGIIVTFMRHSFFNSLARTRHLFLFSLSFNFILWSTESAKSTIQWVLFLLLIMISSGCLAEIRWFVCMSKSYRSLYISFSRTDAGLCEYHLFLWFNLNFLHNCQWISLPMHTLGFCLILFLC